MPEIGDSLGRYTLLKKLASGGMGEVFLAAKPGPVGFGPRVALKVLREQLASDQTFIDMLVDEANISMFLNHQNVVSVLDLAEDRGTYYIAMEYVQGVTVESLLERLISKQRRFDLAVALYVTSELCRALKYAHTRVNHAGEPLNIIHRDVTPANILLSIQGEVKLTDFGIARAKGRIHQTQAGVLKGKFGYMAPEMIRYEAIDARADLFCAGVVIYLMITGRHPVAGATVMEAIQRYEDKQIPKPSTINPEIPQTLDQIVMRCLEPQPDNRWASAAALAAAVQDVVLKNPAWRRDVQDGATRLSDLIREIAPEMYSDPVPADMSERLLKEALAREGIQLNPTRDSSTSPVVKTPDTPEPLEDTSPPPPLRPPQRPRAFSGPATDRHAEALEMESFNQTTSEAAVPPYLFDTMSSAEQKARVQHHPELETEEGLALADVFAVRQELLDEKKVDPENIAYRRGEVSLKKSKKRESGLPRMDTGDFPSPIENAGDEIPTGVAPQEATLALSALTGTDGGIEVAFPESSTDRHRLHEEMLAEQPLPSVKSGGGKSGVVKSGAAKAAAEVEISSDDGRTVVGMYVLPDPEPEVRTGGGPRDTDENGPVLEEPLREGAVPEDSGLADDGGKTVMGMMPDWGDATANEPITGDRLPQEMMYSPRGPAPDEATRAYQAVDGAKARAGFREGDDAETVIPLGPDGKDVDYNEWARDAGLEPQTTNDSTLLDGMDAAAVNEAMRARALTAKKEPRLLPRESPTPKDIDKITTDSDELDMDGIVADSLKTGKHKAQDERTIAGPAMLQGPMRIAFRDDGSPILADQEASGANAAAAALAAHSANSEPVLRKKPAPMLREKKRGPQPSEPPQDNPTHAEREGKVDVGTKTGKWMAGQLSSSELEWDDDAAARRAVATRNNAPGRSTGANVQAYSPPAPAIHPPPSHSSPRPVVVQTSDPRVAPTAIHSQQQTAGSFSRNWPVIAALAAAFLAVGVVTGVLLFTRVLWPKLKLESDPRGAVVIVDDVQVDGRSPVTVKVEPERPHSIEFRLEGHHPERREITDGVGRGRTYALQVSLRRIMPQLDMNGVQGVVFVNGQEVGRGSRVVLSDLPADRPVKIRVEAPGYRTWEGSFESGIKVPEALDVPMMPAEPKKEAPQPKKK